MPESDLKVIYGGMMQLMVIRLMLIIAFPQIDPGFPGAHSQLAIYPAYVLKEVKPPRIYSDNFAKIA